MNNSTIRAVTTYDEQICASLVHLMLGKLRKWPRFALIALGMVTAVAASMIMLLQGRVSALPFLVMFLGSTICMVGFCLETIASRMLIASYGGRFPQLAFAFAPDEIRIECGENKKTYSYGYILRMLEMSGLLFFFMKDGQVYILRHADVRVGYPAFKAILEDRARKS